MVRRVGLVACAILGASATGAAAQAILGLVVQAGMQADHDREVACQAGTPPSPGLAAETEKASEARFAEYFARVGVNDRSGTTRLFIHSGSTARWTGPGGSQPVTAIADPVGAMRNYGTLTRKYFVVSNDAQSARGVWTLAIPETADPSKIDTYEYGVDFLAGNWAGFWLWHVHLYRAPDTAPPPPDKFCHIAPDAAY